MRYHSYFVLCAITAAASACSGGGSLTSGSASKKDKSSTPAAAAAGSGDGAIQPAPPPDNGDIVIEPVTPPVDVAGAFLTCGPATDATGLEEKVPFGCVYRDATTRAKLQGTPATPVATVNLGSGATVTPAMTPAPAASVWHFHFGLTQAEADDAVSLSLTTTIDGVATTTTTLRVDEAADAVAGAAVTSGEAYMFATSAVFSGAEIGHTIGGDSTCQALGVNGHGTQWHALLFSSYNPRFGLFSQLTKVMRLDGTILARSFDDFWSFNTLRAPVQDEHGDDPLATVDGDNLVWSGFTVGGVNGVKDKAASASDTCYDWSSSAADATAVAGTLNGSGSGSDDWLGATVVNCGGRHHLYCISQ